MALIPLALRGVKYEPKAAEALLRRNLLIYGVGGVIIPFVGIKAIDMLLVAMHLADGDLNMHATTTLASPAQTHTATVTHSVWGTSIRFTILTTLLFGIGYPLVVTGIAGAMFPHKAAGSLILKNGQVIGSELLAQSFTSDRYFHPRPSAAGNGYDATSSGGSNLAQSNAKLVQRIQGDIDKLAARIPATRFLSTR